jgi:hypothetical protein
MTWPKAVRSKKALTPTEVALVLVHAAYFMSRWPTPENEKCDTAL